MTRSSDIYDFNSNLLKASESKNIDEAKTEWFIVRKEERDINSGRCICNRKIKNITFLYNIRTKLNIMVGSSCFNKFKMDSVKLGNKVLRCILSNNLEKGEYEIIDNIIIYSDDVKDQLIIYFKHKINDKIAKYLN